MCELTTGALPPLFTLCLAWGAYTAVSLLQAALRRAQGRQQGPEEVSRAERAWAMRRTSAGMMSAMAAPHWAFVRALPPRVWAHGVRALAALEHRCRAQPHRRGPKKKAPPERAAYHNGKHGATATLLAQG